MRLLTSADLIKLGFITPFVIYLIGVLILSQMTAPPIVHMPWLAAN